MEDSSTSGNFLKYRIELLERDLRVLREQACKDLEAHERTTHSLREGLQRSELKIIQLEERLKNYQLAQSAFTTIASTIAAILGIFK